MTYDYARERQLAAEGKDLVHVDGKLKAVRRGPLPPEERRVGGHWHDAADVPTDAELAADASAQRHKP